MRLAHDFDPRRKHRRSLAPKPELEISQWWIRIDLFILVVLLSWSSRDRLYRVKLRIVHSDVRNVLTSYLYRLRTILIIVLSCICVFLLILLASYRGIPSYVYIMMVCVGLHLIQSAFTGDYSYYL
jgi:ABC-type xylose transport system permease subunit